MTRKVRRDTTLLAIAASARGDVAMAAQLFALVGVSYIAPKKG